MTGSDFALHCAQFKRGPKRGPKTRVVQKIKKRLHLEILRILNLDEEKTMFVFCFHLNKPTLPKLVIAPCTCDCLHLVPCLGIIDPTIVTLMIAVLLVDQCLLFNTFSGFL